MPCTTITLVSRVEQVRSIVSALHAAGFTTDAISVVFPQRPGPGTDTALPPDLAEANHQTGQGAAIGVVTGGVLGTAAAWLTGAGLISIPGIGPLLAAGPILTILAGIGLGASLGGLTGALVGMGISEIDAKRFATSISDGRTLIAVRTEDEERARIVEHFMRQSAGEEISHFTWPGVEQPTIAGTAH